MNGNKLICLRCNHEWYSKLANLPKVCPRCKSYKWNEEKKNK